jgi:TonB family protein
MATGLWYRKMYLAKERIMKKYFGWPIVCVCFVAPVVISQMMLFPLCGFAQSVNYYGAHSGFGLATSSSVPPQVMTGSPEMRGAYGDYVYEQIWGQTRPITQDLLHGIGTLTMTIGLMVDSNGQCQNINVIQSSDNKAFDTAILNAASKMHFQKVLPPPGWSGEVTIKESYSGNLSGNIRNLSGRKLQELKNGPYHEVQPPPPIFTHRIAEPPRVLSYGGRNNVNAIEANIYGRGISLDSAEAHVIRGNWYRVNGDYETALQHYDQAIQIDPTLWDAYCSREGARLQLGDKKGAYQDKVLTNAWSEVGNIEKHGKPTNSSGWMDLAHAHLILGNFAAAKEDIASASLFNLNSAYDYAQYDFQKGDRCFANGNYNEAINYYSRMLDYPGVFYLRAKAKAAQGDEQGSNADINAEIERVYANFKPIPINY